MTDEKKRDFKRKSVQQLTRRDFIRILGVTAVGSGTQIMIVGCGSNPASQQGADGGSDLDAGAGPAGDAGGGSDAETRPRRHYPVVGPHRSIDEGLCIGCGQCVRLCPMSAISLADGKSSIDASECTECNVCTRAGVCPADAITTVRLEWPREVRSIFSDPVGTHESTRMPGRGTEGMKTNDSKNVFNQGDLGVIIELGRPALGARFHDVEKVVKKFKAAGYELAEQNPVASLVKDDTGALDPEVLDEKVISCVLEFVLPQSEARQLMQMVQQLSTEVETIFNLCVALRADEQGESPLDSLFDSAVFRLPNGKVNIGLAADIVG